MYLTVGHFFVPDLDTVLDLGILIDASDASVTNWTTILKFLSSVVGYFNISASGTHVGLLVFSLEAEIRLYFDTLHGTNMTVENVKNAVSTLLPKGGPSRFDRALLLAEQELFNEGTGMRDEVPKVWTEGTSKSTLSHFSILLD